MAVHARAQKMVAGADYYFSRSFGHPDRFNGGISYCAVYLYVILNCPIFMSSLTEKQKNEIEARYKTESAKKIAQDLNVGTALVRDYIGSTLLKQQKGGRRFLFPVVIVILPIFILLVCELFLRIANYGGDISLVLTRKIGGQKYYQINKHVAKRYFPGNDLTVPDARNAVFEYIKSPNTFRIFCLGGSTTAGFPYQYNATFPSLLSDRLHLLFPHRNFEVINVGISAINSYSVLDFTSELVRYKPDLFLIYMGHNEFYGALGVASTQSLGENRAFIKFYLRLEKFRLFLLFRDIILKTKKLFVTRQNGPASTLMESVAADKSLLLHGRKYNLARQNFAANLTEILEIIQKHGTPVLVSTLVSNLKDQYPFKSVLSQGIPKKDWARFFDKGVRLENRGEYDHALSEFSRANALDSMAAKLHFEAGRCYEKLSKFDTALNEYRWARDLDVIRFRAPTEFNDVIRNVCAQKKVSVVDMVNVFQENSQHGIPGDNLFLEHLHPNFTGNYLVADAFCRAMSSNNIILAADKWPWSRDFDKEKNMQHAFVTDLDEEIANYRVQNLTSYWPFRKQKIIRPEGKSEYDVLLRKTVEALVRRQLPWNEGHYRVAKFLAKQGEFEKAEREYRAVVKVMPYDFYPYLFLGNMLMEQKKYIQAEKAYKNSIARSPAFPFAYAKLGLLYLNQKRPQQAKPYLLKAVQVGEKRKQFTDTDLARAKYLLALAYSQSNELQAAKSVAEQALQLSTDDHRIKTLLIKINRAIALKK